MDKEDVLTDIGLSRNEAKAYIALLDLGTSTAGKVAEHAKLHRTNTYDVLERLVEKGLASHVQLDNTKHFLPSSPEMLKGYLRAKEQQLDNIIPQLRLAQKLSVSKGAASVYEGPSVIISIFFELLEYDEDILIYGIPKQAPEIMKHRIMHFHNARIPRGVVMKHIYNYNATERIAFLNTLDKTEARYLPEEYDTEVSTLICGPEVLLILWKEPVTSIRIPNSELAEAYRKYFSILWEQATEP